MAEQQQSVVYVDGLGFIPIASGQSAPEAIAAAQAKRAGANPGESGTLAQGPGGQRVGLQLPDMNTLDASGQEAMRDVGTQVLQSIPQLASLVAQMIPQARGLRAVASVGIPGMTRAVTNVIGGRPAQEGILGEMALGGATHIPLAGAERLTNWGKNMNREALFSQTPLDDITSAGESALPAKAMELRARATPSGVADMKARAAANTHGGVQLGMEGELAQLLEGIRKKVNVRGSSGGPTAIVPGSGAVTTLARATGAGPALGQLTAPIAGAIKGNPARRMAMGQNLARPGNLVDTNTLGQGSSAALKMLMAYYQSLENKAPVPGTLPQRRAPR